MQKAGESSTRIDQERNKENTLKYIKSKDN